MAEIKLTLTNEQAALLTALAAQVAGQQPEPEPEPKPAIKSAKFWLARFEAQWAQEYASIYRDWGERPDRTYFLRIPQGAALDAWLAGGEDGWLDASYDLAARWVKTVLALPDNQRSSLNDLMTAHDVARLLYSAMRKGITHPQHGAILNGLIAIWDYWYPKGGGGVKRLFTHGAWRSFMLAWFMDMLDGTALRMHQYNEVQEWALPAVAAQYNKTARGWRYMFDDSSTFDPADAPDNDGYCDLSHAQDDADGIVLLARAGHEFGQQWLPRMIATFNACYKPNATVDGKAVPGGRFTFNTDGTNRGNPYPSTYGWPHVSMIGWHRLGAVDVAVQQALEGYVLGQGESYKAPQYAVMAANAAAHGVTG